MPKAVWRLLMLCRHDSEDVAQVSVCGSDRAGHASLLPPLFYGGLARTMQHAVRALGSVAALDEAAVLINSTQCCLAALSRSRSNLFPLRLVLQA